METLWSLAKERAENAASEDDARLIFGETMYDMLALEASSHPVNCLKVLGTSSGILYPPDKLHPNKRFALSQDVLLRRSNQWTLQRKWQMAFCKSDWEG